MEREEGGRREKRGKEGGREGEGVRKEKERKEGGGSK
jgi:hypothetical protein